jgi:hypothetical protein
VHELELRRFLINGYDVSFTLRKNALFSGSEGTSMH